MKIIVSFNEAVEILNTHFQNLYGNVESVEIQEEPGVGSSSHTPELMTALVNEVLRWARTRPSASNEKILRVKLVRMLTGLGLKEAKEFEDAESHVLPHDVWSGFRGDRHRVYCAVLQTFSDFPQGDFDKQFCVIWKVE